MLIVRLSIGVVLLGPTLALALAVQAPSPSPSATASAHPSGQPIPRPSPHVHVSYPTPMGPGSTARLEQLAADLASPDPAVRADAARQLGHAVNIDRAVATGHLVRALGDSDATVREKAAEALRYSAAANPEAVRALCARVGAGPMESRRRVEPDFSAVGGGSSLTLRKPMEADVYILQFEPIASTTASARPSTALRTKNGLRTAKVGRLA